MSFAPKLCLLPLLLMGIVHAKDYTAVAYLNHISRVGPQAEPATASAEVGGSSCMVLPACGSVRSTAESNHLNVAVDYYEGGGLFGSAVLAPDGLIGSPDPDADYPAWGEAALHDAAFMPQAGKIRFTVESTSYAPSGQAGADFLLHLNRRRDDGSIEQISIAAEVNRYVIEGEDLSPDHTVWQSPWYEIQSQQALNGAFSFDYTLSAYVYASGFTSVSHSTVTSSIAYEIVPVPEPEIGALLLAGVSFAGVVRLARRKRKTEHRTRSPALP